jgi:lipopolysaccharide/colanic/teichoic acid biosynthesis glycosyltransferase
MEVSKKEIQFVTLSVPTLPFAEGVAYKLIKRLGDVLLASLALILSIPIVAIVFVLIKLEDGGPFLYRQIRIGRFGVPFWIYKIRSMRTDADALKVKVLKIDPETNRGGWKEKDDPRVTKVGRFIRKFSVDELPQLFHVLNGEMTIIGPRPHVPLEVEHYRPEDRVRLMVKPGLVCLREINGRSDVDFETTLELDSQYVHCRSLGYDLMILLKVLPVVFLGRGAY